MDSTQAVLLVDAIDRNTFQQTITVGWIFLALGIGLGWQFMMSIRKGF